MNRSFKYTPGQFAELSVAGQGEIPIGIASSPTEKGFIKFTVNKVGKVSSYIHNMQAGDIMGVRGPLGNWYPWDLFEGKNMVIVGGGFAFTTLRSSIVYMLDPANRSRFGDITSSTARAFPDCCSTRTNWRPGSSGMTSGCTSPLTAPPIPNWKYNVGFVPSVTKQKAPDSENSYAIICGPPIMIKFTLPVLTELGFPPERIISSLEMRMKCGIGICGRCNIGTEYVCKDGPVFTLEQLSRLPNEY